MPDRRIILSIALAALIATAGCSTFIPGGDDGAQGQQDLTTTTASEAGSDTQSPTGEQQTTTEYNLNKKLYTEGQLIPSRVYGRHSEIIADANSYRVTIQEGHAFPVEDSGSRGSTSTTTQVSYNIPEDTHSKFVYSNGYRTEVYQSPTTDVKYRESPDGNRTYFGKNATSEITPHSHAPRKLMQIVNNTDFSFQDKGTVSGAEGYIYTATRVSDFSAGAFQQFSFTRDDLESATLTIVIGEDGVIRLLRFNGDYRTEAGLNTIMLTKGYDRVNDIRAGKPLWVENAKETLANPAPEDYITRRLYEESGYTGLAATVTAKKKAFDAGAVFVRYAELPDSAPDALKSAAVGTPVQFHYPPDQTELIDGRFIYDPDHTPGKKGENLVILIYDPANDQVFILHNAKNRKASTDVIFTIKNKHRFAYEEAYIVLAHSPTYQSESQ